MVVAVDSDDEVSERSSKTVAGSYYVWCRRVWRQWNIFRSRRCSKVYTSGETKQGVQRTVQLSHLSSPKRLLRFEASDLLDGGQSGAQRVASFSIDRTSSSRSNSSRSASLRTRSSSLARSATICRVLSRGAEVDELATGTGEEPCRFLGECEVVRWVTSDEDEEDEAEEERLDRETAGAGRRQGVSAGGGYARIYLTH